MTKPHDFDYAPANGAVAIGRGYQGYYPSPKDTALVASPRPMIGRAALRVAGMSGFYSESSAA